MTDQQDWMRQAAEEIRKSRSKFYSQISDNALDWGDIPVNEIDKIIVDIIAKHAPKENEERPKPTDTNQTMPKVKGKHFRCDCGCNVFTLKDHLYYCNACDAIYKGTPKENPYKQGFEDGFKAGLKEKYKN